MGKGIAKDRARGSGPTRGPRDAAAIERAAELEREALAAISTFGAEADPLGNSSHGAEQEEVTLENSTRPAPIQSPAELKRVPRDKLPGVAAELRETIVRNVARNGGHLASSLGVVELTVASTTCSIALGTVSSGTSAPGVCPQDPHGEADVFPTLRTFGGISGFPRISRAPATRSARATPAPSISRPSNGGRPGSRKEKNRVVAVIGTAPSPPVSPSRG